MNASFLPSALKSPRNGSSKDQYNRFAACAASRFTITEIARNEIGVRELTGHNDGRRVEAYLSTVKLRKGQPWCAAFISWVYAKAGFPKPRSGWSPDLFPPSRLARSALPGNVAGIYFPDLKRIAHVGLVVEQKGSWVYTIEGNTTVEGNREGGGVFKKIRHIRTIHSIADWVTERRTPQWENR
ncbi:C40 family peptidase [Pedobacter hartonius]|uniref:peptidoglycan-binding protein n=1 Tax=Pedobacter hartonius TaxID=425514 RepID=UPI001FE04E44|nr:peptidoglycan-binding protein [Pedobacter hartonius]